MTPSGTSHLPLNRLRELPTVYDVVIGDFGREAATRYMSILAEEERLFLTRMLTRLGLPFLDEYRRIMFAHVGDVAFLKAATIQSVWAEEGHLTDEVLVAVKEHDVPPDLIARLACVIRDEAEVASRRRHGRVRVVLPCNALSETLEESARLASDETAMKTVAESVRYAPAWHSQSLPRITAHGVVECALTRLARSGKISAAPFVVLGAQMAREQYVRFGGPLGMSVLPLTKEQQRVIDDAVLLCIDGSQDNITDAKAEIAATVLSPLTSQHPSLVILEACTDFDFGLGLDSVRLMAQHMVQDCYQWLARQ